MNQLLQYYTRRTNYDIMLRELLDLLLLQHWQSIVQLLLGHVHSDVLESLSPGKYIVRQSRPHCFNQFFNCIPTKVM